MASLEVVNVSVDLGISLSVNLCAVLLVISKIVTDAVILLTLRVESKVAWFRTALAGCLGLSAW